MKMADKPFVETITDMVTDVTDAETYTKYKVGDLELNMFKRSNAPVFKVGDFIEATYRKVAKDGKTIYNMLNGKIIVKDNTNSKPKDVKVEKDQYGVDEYDLTEKKAESKTIPIHTIQKAKAIKQNSAKVYNLGMAKNGACVILGNLLLAKYTKISSEFVAEYEDLAGATIKTKYKSLVKELMEANSELSTEFELTENEK